MSNLLCLPFRLVDNLDLRSTLTDIIKKDYFQPASTFSADIDKAQHLHTAVAAGSRNTSVDLTKYEQDICQYYYMAEDLARKFHDHAVTFDWYGTLGYKPTHCPVTTWKHLQYELTFQLGALYSHRASQQSVHSDEGIKAACLAYKLASGCFQMLLQQHIPLADFDQQTLSALRSLMLAQAQELIWLKAVTNPSMKNTVVARLAMKVSDLYAEAWEHANNSDKITLDWTNYMKVKQLHLKAGAHYRMSIVAQDSFDYGVQVAHLKYAASLAKEAAKHKRYVSEFVLEDLKGLTTTVEDTLRTAEKDNDLVYLKPVPATQDLPPIAGVSMVDAETPPTLLSRGSTPHYFNTLVPFSVIQIAQAFRERQDKYVVENFHEPLQALTRMLNGFLSDRDLPATIDMLQKPENLPESIIHHAKEIQSIGGIRIIEDSMREISKLCDKCKELVLDCEERLRLEKQEDDMMREREGTARWLRQPSVDAAVEYTARIEKMKDYLRQGHESDVLIGDSYRSIKSLLEAYCKGHQALMDQIPRSTAVTLDATLGKLTADLRGLLSEVDKMEKSRQRFLSSIEVKSREHNVLSVILSEFKVNPNAFLSPEGVIEPVKFEAVYERHIRFLSTDLKYVEQQKKQQMVLEQKIEATNAEFVEKKNIPYNEKQQARLGALQVLEEAYVRYLELISNLNHASNFYSDFLDRGNVVLHDTDQYLYARREEARELEISIRNQNKLQDIEQSMARTPANLAAPRSQKPATWDPSKVIRFG